MSTTVIVHVANEDAFVAEIEVMPQPTDTIVVLANPRRRDGKAIHQFDMEASSVIFPWTRINFLEIMADRGSRDELIEFFRDE